MKKLCPLSLMMLLPLLGFAQNAKTDAPKTPPKETINTYKVFPKDGHEAAFKAAFGAFSAKTLIRHNHLKPGPGPCALENLKPWKKIWEKRGINVGVWSGFFSGEPQIVIVYRLKNGWKDLDADIISTRKAFEEVGGPDAYEVALEELA